MLLNYAILLILLPESTNCSEGVQLNGGTNYNDIYFSVLYSVGWSVDQNVGGFGEEPGIKVQVINLVRSVRTVMRGV